MNSMPVFGWVLLALGVAAGAAGAIAFLMTRAFVATAARAEATVVVTEDVLKDKATGAPTDYKAKFWIAEFKDRKGLLQRLQLGESMDVKMAGIQLGQAPDPSLPSAGSKVSVLFDPNNPIKVRRDTFKELWMLPAACLAGAAVFLALAAALWVMAP